MTPTQRFFVRIMFELEVRRAEGAAFEKLFNAVMTRRCGDYRPIRPYGNQGDRKNDGYVPASGTYYQLYAPKEPRESLAAAARKAQVDFAGLKQYWQAVCPIMVYRFVFNDRYGGSVVPIERALAEIALQHGVDAGPFLAKDLEAEALELNLAHLQDVLGMVIPESGLLADADYHAIRDVVSHVLDAAMPIVPNGKLMAPDFKAKIQLNGLSEQVGSLLITAALQTSVVDDYFARRSGTLRQDLRDHLAAIYAVQRKDAIAHNLTSDAVFFGLLEATTPKADRMKSAVQQAALVVLAYYFEACDIFEGPDAAP